MMMMMTRMLNKGVLIVAVALFATAASLDDMAVTATFTTTTTRRLKSSKKNGPPPPKGQYYYFKKSPKKNSKKNPPLTPEEECEKNSNSTGYRWCERTQTCDPPGDDSCFTTEPPTEAPTEAPTKAPTNVSGPDPVNEMCARLVDFANYGCKSVTLKEDENACSAALMKYDATGDGQLSTEEANMMLDVVPANMAKALDAVDVEGSCVRDQVYRIIEVPQDIKRQLSDVSGVVAKLAQTGSDGPGVVYYLYLYYMDRGRTRCVECKCHSWEDCNNKCPEEAPVCKKVGCNSCELPIELNQRCSTASDNDDECGTYNGEQLCCGNWRGILGINVDTGDYYGYSCVQCDNA